MTINLDNLGKVACDTAMRAAAEYIIRNKITPDYAALSESLRKHIRARLPGALDDAKEAFDAGMGQMASATFLASMQLAGIDAAKEVTVVKETV